MAALDEIDDRYGIVPAMAGKQTAPILGQAITIPGKPGDELAPGTRNSILKQADLK